MELNETQLRNRESEYEQKMAELQEQLQKEEELKSKEEERESKLKTLLAKSKKGFVEARQQLTAKESECADLTAKVLHKVIEI